MGNARHNFADNFTAIGVRGFSNRVTLPWALVCMLVLSCVRGLSNRVTLPWALVCMLVLS